APTSWASVTVVEADPVAFTSPLRTEPVWSLAAWRLIEPPGFVMTVPLPTVIFSAFTRNAMPGKVSVPARVTSSTPSPPSIVSVDVGTGNEMLSIVGAVAMRLPVLPSFWIVMWSLPELPLMVTAATGVVGAGLGTIVIGSSPVYTIAAPSNVMVPELALLAVADTEEWLPVMTSVSNPPGPPSITP